MEKFIRIPGRRRSITKNMIESAIESTLSNAEASRWLGISYNTYKKWAKYYNLFDSNLNQAGKGIPKRKSNFKVEINDIFEGKIEILNFLNENYRIMYFF